MAKVFMDELDARDSVAETVMSALLTRGSSYDYATIARSAYNAAEAFLAERELRLDADDEAEVRGGGDDN